MTHRSIRSFLVRTLTLAGALLAATSSNAQINYTSFPSSTGLNLVGNASIATTSSRLRLTTNATGQIGAAWYTTQQQVSQGFSTTFQFIVTNTTGGGADGFAFLIQSSSATAISAGGGGCTLGYEGVPQSVAVEIDLYQNGGACTGTANVNDPNGNHISIHTLGAAPNSASENASIGVYSPATSMKNGSSHTVQIVYVPGTMTVFFDGSTSPNITAPLNLGPMFAASSGKAWVGFTGATGGAYERHEIQSWSFTPSTLAAPAGFGAMTPSPIAAGASGVITVGLTPASGTPNAISSVVVDASSIGLSSTLALNDSGTGGDPAAGDNNWSAQVAIPISTLGGPRALPFVITDAQGRTGSGTISFTVNAPNPGDDRRPATPTITEPGVEGQITNGADVHMVTANFFSPIGANHLCSDWELWKTSTNQRVWHATCVNDGALKVHIHLGDGVFEGPYLGRTTLEYDNDFSLKVRHRDDSGDPVSEYSYWATRNFHTAPPSTIFPYSEDDLATTPRPVWQIDGSGPVSLPIGASLVLGSAANDLLLRIDGTAGGDQLTNPAALANHVNVLVTVTAGPSGPWAVGPSTVTVVDHDCGTHNIYLPAISLATSGQVRYWVTSSGSTYVASTGQTTPNFTTIARGTLSPWEIRQPGYVVEQFASNFQLPVNMAFVPNPGPNPTDVFFYVTELYGQIKVVTRNGSVSDYATGLLNYNPTGIFPGSGECGVTGIVVEPTTGDLFVTMLYAVTTGDPSQLRPKVVRMHSTDGGHTLAAQTTLVSFPNEPQGQSHQISNITIGPDGKLYVHMGDGFDQTKGQDLTSARGKVLRLNFDGSPASDNPFYNAADGLTPRDQVWLYGLRNPFGGAWRLSDGKHFTVENGPSNDRISMAVAGRNYLYTGSDASMNNYNALAISNSPLAAIWYPAHGPVNMAFAQTGVFNGSGFPAEKMDHAFITESGPTYASGAQTLGKRISEFVFGADGSLQLGPVPLVEYTGSGFASCVGIAMGPDGLYFSELYKDLNATAPNVRGANILRVRYVGVSGTCPMCPADFNGVNGVNVQDIFDFLTSWFAGDPRADFNGVNGISVQDIFDYLAAWFTGC